MMLVYRHIEVMEREAAQDRLAGQARAHARATRPRRPSLALRLIGEIRSLPGWAVRRGRAVRDGAGLPATHQG